MTTITLTEGNDSWLVFDGFLGGTSEATLRSVKNTTIDAAGGRDTAILDYPFPNTWFRMGVSTAGVVTLSNASGSITFQNFELFQFKNCMIGVGSAGDDSVTGGSGADPGLFGLDGNDTLDGGGGADTLYGGAGNDTYVIDRSGDVIDETLNTASGVVDAGGTDTVRATIDYTLGARLENLQLLGTTPVNGTGNASANVLGGNIAANRLEGGEGNDTLDGGGGTDTLVGGAGNDVYGIEAAGDVVQEADGGGTDLVQSAIDFVLGNFVENLTLTGAAAVSGAGNALANMLLGNDAGNRLDGGDGNDTLDGGAGSDALAGGAGDDLQGGGSGNDTLNGGAGADTLLGGAGSDSYVVDSALDVIDEATQRGGSTDAGGKDVVNSAVSWTLGSFLENLALTGNAASNGTGNGLANALSGNGAANVLAGGGGADVLRGGGGKDTLIGGAGGDSFLFNSPLNASSNVDTIKDYDAGGTADRIQLDDDIFTALGPVGATTALPAAMFHGGSAATSADQRVVYNPGTGALFYDADGSGPGAQVRFATIGTTTHPLLDATDFFIVA